MGSSALQVSLFPIDSFMIPIGASGARPTRTILGQAHGPVGSMRTKKGPFDLRSSAPHPIFALFFRRKGLSEKSTRSELGLISRCKPVAPLRDLDS